MARPVARVAVDVSLSHLDRPFDYRVSAEHDAEAVPGARVRVRFAGRLRDGFVLERLAETDHLGSLAPVSKVISAEPVLTAEVAALVRAVADHYAGSFADVMRLAVPSRHAATERAERRRRPEPAAEAGSDPGPWAGYPTGPALLDALAAGAGPRAYWQLTPSSDPSGDWATGFAGAAAATRRSGRGAVLVVPDQRDLQHLERACTVELGAGGFAVLTAETGPAARYRAFLAALRGEVRVVIGNRAAAYAPVADLGLVALYDDGDDLLDEPRAPYPHSRTVLALRAAQTGSAVLLAGYGRTAEVQQLLDRGWLRELVADRSAVRHTAPRVRVTGDSDHALARDPAARAARLPHEVFELVRSALPQGPVLVQVPRGGYLVSLVCQSCRDPVRCAHCGGPVRADRGQVRCGWCDRPVVDWTCPICGSNRLRAPVVGADRTAEELGRAFPGTPVRQSSAGQVLASVPDTPALVVATPGAEPPAVGGYAAAVLLDTALLLLRADLRAGEEALRRWLNVVALVRPGAAGGSVLAAGESADRSLQALVRVDPGGYAIRELADRAEAHYPPVAKLVTVDGTDAALSEFRELLHPPEAMEMLGPVDLGRPGEDPLRRLTIRVPARFGPSLVRAVKDAVSVRSAKKSEGALRVRVDPAVIG